MCSRDVNTRVLSKTRDGLLAVICRETALDDMATMRGQDPLTARTSKAVNPPNRAQSGHTIRIAAD
jgi:hypothetical protein